MKLLRPFILTLLLFVGLIGLGIYLWLGKQPGVNLLAFGVLLLVILRFLPNGLMGLLRGRP